MTKICHSAFKKGHYSITFEIRTTSPWSAAYSEVFSTFCDVSVLRKDSRRRRVMPLMKTSLNFWAWRQWIKAAMMKLRLIGLVIPDLSSYFSCHVWCFSPEWSLLKDMAFGIGEEIHKALYKLVMNKGQYGITIEIKTTWPYQPGYIELFWSSVLRKDS